jgi:hypothetical protein
MNYKSECIQEAARRLLRYSDVYFSDITHCLKIKPVPSPDQIPPPPSAIEPDKNFTFIWRGVEFNARWHFSSHGESYDFRQHRTVSAHTETAPMIVVSRELIEVGPDAVPDVSGDIWGPSETDIAAVSESVRSILRQAGFDV